MKKDGNTKLYDYKLEDVKKTSIRHFLTSLGHKMTSKNGRHVTNSPLQAGDTNPSFYIYPENTFYDWSTGIGGTIIDLIMNMYGLDFRQAIDFLGGDNPDVELVEFKPVKTKKRDIKFNIETYYCRETSNLEKVMAYMDSRLLRFNQCNAGQFFTKPDKKWQSNVSVMFYHRDEYGNICGAKFRKIEPEGKGDKWSSRGRLFYYVLENIICPDTIPTVFITESETSSNSLHSYFAETGRKNYVILCFGGVHSAPDLLPLKYDWCAKRFILIDYDGSEKDYNKRIKALEHLNAKDIKLALPKGEDINSMYVKGEMEQFNNLFDKVF
jgi:hypothetical protein